MNASTATKPPLTGRGGWARRGMPDNNGDGFGDTIYYQFCAPKHVGSDFATIDSSWHGGYPPTFNQWAYDGFAVSQGVRQIQERINRLNNTPASAALPVTGILDERTESAIVAAQIKLHVAADGEAGPTTCLHLFWPSVPAAVAYKLTNNVHTGYVDKLSPWIGGITSHESAWDPGAVGSAENGQDDFGFAQINGPANPTMTAAQRFHYTDAFQYAAYRLDRALTQYQYTDRQAIADYGYPGVAADWHRRGTEAPPPGASPETVELYAHVSQMCDQVQAWRPPL